MNVYSLVRCVMQDVIVVGSSRSGGASHDVVLRVRDRRIEINHYALSAVFLIPHYRQLDLRSPWIAFFERKFVRGQFTFARDVAGHIVSSFLSPEERFAVWDAIQGMPGAITQSAGGIDRSQSGLGLVETRAFYHYAERWLTIETRGKWPFVVRARLPHEAAKAFGSPELQ